MTQEDFIALAERQLADYVREDGALAAQEEGVRRKRSEIQQRIDDIRSSIRVYRDLMGIGAEQPPQPVGLFDDIPMGTIADMAAVILKKQGQPMKVAEVARVLEATGKLKAGKTSAHQNYGTVYGTLQRDRRFERLAQGRFGLAATNGVHGVHPSEPTQPFEQSPDVPQG